MFHDRVRLSGDCVWIRCWADCWPVLHPARSEPSRPVGSWGPIGHLTLKRRWRSARLVRCICPSGRRRRTRWCSILADGFLLPVSCSRGCRDGGVVGYCLHSLASPSIAGIAEPCPVDPRTGPRTRHASSPGDLVRPNRRRRLSRGASTLQRCSFLTKQSVQSIGLGALPDAAF